MQTQVDQFLKPLTDKVKLQLSYVWMQWEFGLRCVFVLCESAGVEDEELSAFNPVMGWGQNAFRHLETVLQASSRSKETLNSRPASWFFHVSHNSHSNLDISWHLVGFLKRETDSEMWLEFCFTSQLIGLKIKWWVLRMFKSGKGRFNLRRMKIKF